ncbi:MAG: hypothetical protein FWD05_06175 [Oscillospiraceae bacterium]|nr:hypothetical protein [Oscillospiraceae bacterium]
MNKAGIGVGSASIVLVFAVLCLTIFSLITFVIAGNEKAMVDARAELVIAYYEADALAEQILVDILSADLLPETVRGIEVHKRWDDALETELIYFFCDISDIKILYVSFVIHDDTFDILSWHMQATDDWEFDDSLNVWRGE